MLFNYSSNLLPSDIMFDNLPLLRTDCVKFLGVFVDDKLSWNQHINYLCKLIAWDIYQ